MAGQHPRAAQRAGASGAPGAGSGDRSGRDRAQEIGTGEIGFEQAASAAPSSFSLVTSEKEMIRRALAAERGKVERAAASLGISRSSLYEKIRKYGIVVSRT